MKSVIILTLSIVALSGLAGDLLSGVLDERASVEETPAPMLQQTSPTITEEHVSTVNSIKPQSAISNAPLPKEKRRRLDLPVGKEKAICKSFRKNLDEGQSLGRSRDYADKTDSGLTLSCGLFRINFLGEVNSFVEGCEVSFVALDNVDYSGIRLSGLDAVYGSMDGLQMSCLLNIAGRDLYGFQASLCVNGVGGTMSGVQISAVNYSEALDGLQVGLLNIAESGKGVQIGFLNIIADSSLPIFPIINARF